MKIPTRLRYGLRFLSNIAKYYETDTLVSISKISEEEHISNKYLEQIISKFVNAGIIRGTRGKGGGYSLIKDPAKLSLYDISLVLGEDFNFLDCVRREDACENAVACTTHPFWKEYSEMSVNLFRSHSLSEYIRKEKKV